MTAATLYRPAGYGRTAYVPSGPLRAGDILTSPRTGQRFVFRYAVSRTTATAFGKIAVSPIPLDSISGTPADYTVNLYVIAFGAHLKVG